MHQRIDGGVVGLGVGSMIGKGTGRDVALVLGAIGGAYAGHKVQQRYAKPVGGQQIVVRTTTGVLVTITQPANMSLAVGQNVTIQGSGEDARVVPR
ncbi:MAG: glycine zipper 2TM domain-containing protein [Rhodocyclaceae bacterium]|nr:glycine zipper 2TM domain-containing protein [Rhodocyclaceae bacterium]MCC6880070.1 glycine zipper 2TM domain-containing protein [Rhodocyclaceae bacterium]MCL4681852.1 glycine zipper 2TM domain-containing protein [Rhodocyclaceae bacterium]